MNFSFHLRTTSCLAKRDAKAIIFLLDDRDEINWSKDIKALSMINRSAIAAAPLLDQTIKKQFSGGFQTTRCTSVTFF